MEKQRFTSGLLLLVTLLHGCIAHGSSEQERKAYIVYMGNAAKTHIPSVDRHHTLLSSVIQDEDIARQSLIHSYGRSFDAFAAHLSPKEVKRLKENENVVSVFPSTIRKLRTTRSWDFIGMPLTVKRSPQIESDIIVGVFDSGVYINAPSFDDKGFGPPPSKWKGVCQTGGNFTGCNNKVIGAKVYNIEPTMLDPHPSPADYNGHGTHTSSTVAGIQVKGASLYGVGLGTARGGVPSARLAIYKVCGDGGGCSDINIMAAFDDAIEDGVDLISVSLGGSPTEYFDDSIAIGTFHAMRKGILTSCSAGNDGPDPASASNLAPWILTVGASGMDRQFRTPIVLGNGMGTSGISVNTYTAGEKMYPLTSGSKATNDPDGSGFLGYCDSTLDASKVKGKIILCRGGIDTVVKAMGAEGMILASDDSLDIGFTFVLPTASLNTGRADKIDQYINSTKNPQAAIYKSKGVNVTAPFVASFSSRGPNTISHTILKPDIVAPGVDILAAYSKLATVTGSEVDNRFDVYNIISGTSMSCPHVAGAAAYVKSFHPDWSPSAIKSALMTTATEMKVKDPLAELASGAGQIDPTKALDPGLVYDISEQDYVRFLCKDGHNETALSLVTGYKVNCSAYPPLPGHDSINYPSMQLQLEDYSSNFSVAFYRTVTNVGPATSVYIATVRSSQKGLKVTVNPAKLAFSAANEKKSFKVKVTGPPLGDASIFSASLEWRSSGYLVKSPIVVTIWGTQEDYD
ncbi:hypothetical protein Tsubulata_009018 [Turnera subulata]|uniref:Uncharacterized protein n=1 Tax=Turnera subulata TaxID=218843 RepID=A0A9Q0FIR4_9ROSI|nr:hypothetical protein Tsubulata_009018 [Turnera subulata]